ncbi:MAG: T9SS type A sorting domain-containing protein [Crocinitomicaceae bacterium]|nr:T9SS type A sorting domain-containing protein [Taishania sp.]
MTIGTSINHNDNDCSVNINANAVALISNSSLNDEAKFIDFNGQVIYTEINSTGAVNWQPNFVMTGFNVQSDYNCVNGNMLNSFAMPNDVYKIICEQDTMYNPIILVQEPLNFTPCVYKSVEGFIYVDNNGDCINNSGDVGITYITPVINGNYIYDPFQNPFSNGNANGNYKFFVQENHLIDYTVSIPSIYAFVFPASPCFQTSYSFTNLPQTGVDFPLQCADFDTHVQYYSTPARPAIPFTLSPRVFNIGCDAVSGTLKLKLDQNVTYNSTLSSHPADYINGDTLVWNFTNLNNLANNTPYFDQFLGGIHLTPSLSVNIGDTLWFDLSTSVATGDVNPANNHLHFGIPIVNSFDPNIKEVSPKGVGIEGLIPMETEALTYTIHFQNTGTAEAINIFVLDTLTASIDPKSLQILANSHNMTPTWINDSVVKFNFPNIHLADSSSNEPESHGFVRFKVNLKDNLPIGTIIKNKAAIYFDTNEPVITNFTTNKLANDLSVSKIEKLNDISVFPNPAKDYVIIRFFEQINGTIELFDLTGKNVYTEEVKQISQKQIDVKQLQNGVYIYQIKANNGQRKSGKLIIN